MTPVLSDQWLTVYGGDVRDVLPTLPAESVHCVVTSPPYWGLRDYGTALWEGGDELHEHTGSVMRTAPPGTAKQASNHGASAVSSGDCSCGAIRQDRQLGLEPTPEEYVANMVDVFREVRRVLRADGTVWLNLGDSYAQQRWGDGAAPPPTNTHNKTAISRSRTGDGLKPKDLVGIPWRVAFALQADGWYLRSDVIWSKPNPMPESVTDRPTKSHEYLFLLSKSPRYFYDADAVREADSGQDHRHRNVLDGQPSLAPPGQRAHAGIRTVDGRNGSGRNLRSVWNIATAPYPGAHFATFPPKLVEPCVKASTSERGVCPECGAPWVRVVEGGNGTYATRKALGYDKPANMKIGVHEGHHNVIHPPGMTHDLTPQAKRTAGWRPSCAHDAEPVPATVLDIFAGSGTVGMVAQSLSRRAVLIDLNPDYLRQCLERNAAVPLGI